MHVEAFDDPPQACIQDTVTRLFEVYEVVEQIATIEGLFYCAPVWSITCLVFCQQFLTLGLESVEDNSEHVG